MPPVIAVDSHAHIFSKTHPFDENRNYTPDGSQIGSVERFLSVLDYHGLSHGLVVAAEPYGTDNSGMLAGIAASNGRLKGVALVSPSADDRELDKLAAGGVVGIRYNLSSFGLSQFEDPATTRMLERLKERGFSMDEIYRFVAPRRTLARRIEKGEPLTLAENDSAQRILRISELADKVFGEHEKAQRWLRKANRSLNGVVPIDLLESETGARLVEEAILRIDHGIYI